MGDNKIIDVYIDDVDAAGIAYGLTVRSHSPDVGSSPIDSNQEQQAEPVTSDETIVQKEVELDCSCCCCCCSCSRCCSLASGVAQGLYLLKWLASTSWLLLRQKTDAHATLLPLLAGLYTLAKLLPALEAVGPSKRTPSGSSIQNNGSWLRPTEIPQVILLLKTVAWPSRPGTRGTLKPVPAFL